MGSSDSLSLNPVIYEMDIATNISNRFAKTLVASKVKNTQASAKEATFTVVLPENAFISEFIMEIGGKSYKAYVKEKEEAKNIYNAAVASGQSAGHVSVSARDSNRFTVSVNIEPESKAVFLLTYEELLQRKYEQYELVINIHPGQIVQVNESRPLKFVKTPSLRTGNEISKNEDKLDPLSDIKIINSTTAVVEFNPDAEKQKQFAHDLNTKESEEPLPKHVVFVLDTSGSMNGRRIEQLKDAMKSIFNEIKRDDFVNIIEFNENVKVWDITEGSSALISYGYEENYEEPFSKLNVGIF
ncbi:hypothetical protein NQ314_003549 [Rhamnusium bicolor]|uniref:Uncharacterized protein n=1 Tax=Rhamnusium bicolor TaxID=1586634 RepID=A0AAV8ZMI8_9CUCU|nr:hypothetical protein NQ314_003549 [Rhamnusium bicolor]